ncbi:MAG: hypothetical protein E6G74_09320 [Alphaproteobacteria bacterium]|nr:MAG: hypothetical protein E6G74_09320 [Alphaproteobacteria bacterium]
MSGLLFLLMLILAGAAAGFYYAALEQVRPFFPPEFRDPYRVRVALDFLIWERSFPAEPRRKYLLSTVLGAAAILCAALLLYLEGQFVAALYFASLFLATIGYAFVTWMKYKDRL